MICRFVPSFAQIATPLNKCLLKYQPAAFESLNTKHFPALDALEKVLITLSYLALSNSSKHTILDTNACDVHAERVLLKKRPDVMVKKIGYWSRALNDGEKRYDITQKECLAIVWSLFLLRPYLGRDRSTTRTDHDSLKWTLNIPYSTSRPARWQLGSAYPNFTFMSLTERVPNTKPKMLSHVQQQLAPTGHHWRMISLS